MGEIRSVQLGVSDPNGSATAIHANVVTLGSDAPVAVTLTHDYQILARPPGYPSRPSFTGTRAADLDYPKTIPNGTTISVLRCEANALIAASAAVLA
jgi:hypothetical protein